MDDETLGSVHFGSDIAMSTKSHTNSHSARKVALRIFGGAGLLADLPTPDGR